MPRKKTEITPTPISSEEAKEMIETAQEFTANAPAAIAPSASLPILKPKKSRNPGKLKPATLRDPLEIRSLDTKKMSDKEKDICINELRADLTLLREQFSNLDGTCQRFADRARNAEAAYEKLRASVEKDMLTIRTAATLMAESIINHTYSK